MAGVVDAHEGEPRVMHKFARRLRGPVRSPHRHGLRVELLLTGPPAGSRTFNSSAQAEQRTERTIQANEGQQRTNKGLEGQQRSIKDKTDRTKDETDKTKDKTYGTKDQTYGTKDKTYRTKGKIDRTKQDKRNKG